MAAKPEMRTAWSRQKPAYKSEVRVAGVRRGSSASTFVAGVNEGEDRRRVAVGVTGQVPVEVWRCHRRHLRSDPGATLSLQMGSMFAPLRDPDVFRQVAVDNELGTIVWPNGADMDPDVLHGDRLAA